MRLKRVNLEEKTFEQIGKEYLEYLEANKKSRWTIKSYTEKFNRLVKFIGENTEIKNINANTIEQYKKHLLKTNRETSVNTHLNHLNTLFKYANSKKYMPPLPIVFYEAQEKTKQVYSKEDLAILLREEPRESFMKYQTRIIIATFVATGLRLSELISLQIQDVDFNNLVIYSRHTKSKKARLLPISNSLRVLLKEWINNRQYKTEKDTLFCNSYGEPLVVDTLRSLMYRYFKHKGIDNNGIHQFRRTFITNAVNNEVDIITLSRITGHANIKTLDKYYVNSKERVASVADKCSIIEDLNVVPKTRKKLGR